jgi:DNA-binding transcriptional LysR family regulator
MTLEQLRIFLAVAQKLHFSRAADSLYITQPAVSAAIQSLETEYKVKLFHRIGRRIKITESGKFLEVEAKTILDRVSLAERGLKELNNLQRGELKLGSSLTIGNYWLPVKISQFQQKYPGIIVNCTLANTEEICQGTSTGIFDLGLIEGEVKPILQKILQHQVIGQDRLQIIVGKLHPWFQKKQVTLGELGTTDWIMREPGSGTQQQFEEALQNWGIDSLKLNVVLVLNTGEMVKAVIENGVAAAGISELMIKKELKLGTLKAIQVVDDRQDKILPLEFKRPFLAVKHRQCFQTQVSKVFEEMLVN